jgi:hypothetical protein
MLLGKAASVQHYCLRANAGGCQLAHPVGVEPEKSANKHEEIVLHGHKDGHKNCVVADSSLQNVVAAWPSLSEPLKAAILAIVNSSAISKGDTR